MAKKKEVLLPPTKTDGWQEVWPGFRVRLLVDGGKDGVSIGLFRCAKGVGSTRHRHDANQYMYCLEGEYYYPETGVRITPGTFYMNPRGSAHGPAVALKDTLMLEMYDGPSAPIPVKTRARKKKAS